MSRYYSDSDDEYAIHRQRSDSVRASGWQTPLPTSTTNITPPSSSSSVTRIVVEPPFGPKKCDYNIDKSQRGRLVITARRRRTPSSDYRSSHNKNHIAIQTFTIPYDADVDRLQSHIEQDTNRLIIEIPRQQRRSSRAQRSPYISTSNAGSRLLRSPDVERMLTSPTGGPQLIRDDTKSSNKNSGNNRKLEYRIDCRGYTADELEVFIQGRDLIVQGKTHTQISEDPTQQRVSKKFSRKITLPNTVDLPKVVSYLDHGELRIEAPLKRGVYQSDEEIVIPGPPPSSSTRTAATLLSNFENRVRSPSPQLRPRYRRNEHFSRRRDYDRSNNRRISSPTRRVRSVDSHRYPLYISSRDLDADDDDEDDTKERTSQRQRTTNYEGNSTTQKQTERPRSVYSPTNVVTNVKTSTTSRQHNYPSDDESNLRF
jgi:HSP20 family molecular chaperone IbpA